VINNGQDLRMTRWEFRLCTNFV